MSNNQPKDINMENQKTYRELKEFLNSLSEEQLDQKVAIDRLDEEGMALTEFGITKEDTYIYDGDYEDFGTLEVLRDRPEDEFEEDKCDLIIPKGTVYLSAEYFPKKTLKTAQSC